MKVQIGKYHEYIKPPTQGFCTFVIDNLLVIKDCVHLKKDDKEWISFPSKSYESKGKTNWYSLVEFQDKADYWEFQEAALKALKAHLEDEKLGEAWDDEETPF